MLEIFIYTGLTILLTLILGLGLSFFLLPKGLDRYRFWLMPWFSIIFLTLVLVILSLAGFTVRQISWPLTIFLLGLSLIAWLRAGKKCLGFNFKRELVIGFVLIVSLAFNFLPVIKRGGSLTSVSLGNLDVIVYASTPDYLLDHSLAESLCENNSLGPSTIINAAFRWGTAIVPAFYLDIFQLQGYQYTFLFQVVLFVLMLPLVYILASLISDSNWIVLGLSLILVGFNVNLLYMLYHNFFGQVFFWGIELCLIILLYNYFFSPAEKFSGFNNQIYLIGLMIVAMFFTYHEPAVFVLSPLIVFLLARLIFKQKPGFCWRGLLKMVLISLITGSISVFSALALDLALAKPNDQPIGWQLFRTEVPFANPFELMGFYSIHSFPPLWWPLALILSLLVVMVIAYGAFKTKKRLFTLTFFLTSFLFHLWGAWRNFFAYNRVLTYLLPLTVVFFVSGLSQLIKSQKRIIVLVILGPIIALELFSAVKLAKRFVREMVMVDQSYISLENIDLNSINEPIYDESFLSDGSISYWRKIWISYFLYNKKPDIRPDPGTAKGVVNLADNSLILISKPTPWFQPPQLYFKEIVFENDWFKIGRLCNQAECFINSQTDFLTIDLGQNNFEDSLLLTGWSVKEVSSRWTNAKQSSLRLIVKKIGWFNLNLEVQSLEVPQTLSIYFEGRLLANRDLTQEWQNYTLPLGQKLEPGIYELSFESSNLYRPADIYPGNQDYRDLGVNFRRINLN